MRKYTIYLSGPMSGCTEAECMDWRNEFEKEIGDQVECLSPVRGEEEAFSEGTFMSPEQVYHGMRTDSGIVARDYFDTKRADILVQYLATAKHISIGTMMEAAWAYSFHTPIVAVLCPTAGLGVHDHPMTRALIDYKTYTVREAVDVAKVLLNL